MLPPADAGLRRLYRVRPGRTFGMYDQYRPGDLVELTDSEAGGFLDKLDLVVEEPPVSEPESVVIDLSDGVDAVEATQAAKALNGRKRGKRG